MTPNLTELMQRVEDSRKATDDMAELCTPGPTIDRERSAHDALTPPADGGGA